MKVIPPSSYEDMYNNEMDIQCENKISSCSKLVNVTALLQTVAKQELFNLFKKIVYD